MKSATTAERVQKHRDNLRKKGLKPVQIWVPDIRREGFADECKKQSVMAKDSDLENNINDFIEDAADLRGWE